MALAVRDIWTTLIHLGLLEPVAAKQLAQQARAQVTADAAEDPLALAKFLILQRVLTPYQAKRVLARRGGELRQGDYLVLDRAGQPPLSRWLRARHLPSSALALIYPCSASPDSKSPVDPAWLRSHAAVAVDGLQPLELLQLSGTAGNDNASWRGLVISDLPAGQTLDQWLENSGPMQSLAAISLGQVLGGALAALHAASLFHGGVRPGRVWIGNEGSVYLLRCGGGPPIFPGDSPAPAYDWFDDDGQAADFASPQWLRGDTHADAQTDVYALGALLYTALSGERVSPGILPSDVAQAAAAGAGGDPLLRVLAAAMAADPAQRFAEMPSMLRALEAVAGLLASPAAAVPASAPQPTTATPAPVEPAQPTPTPLATPSRQPAEAASTETQTSKAGPAKAGHVGTTTAESATKTPRASAPKSRPTQRSAEPSDSATPPEQPRSPAAAAAPVSPAPAEGSTVAASTSPSPSADATPAAAIATAASPRRVRKRTRRSRRGPIMIGSAAVAILLLLMTFLLRPTQRDTPPPARPTIRPPAPQLASPSTTQQSTPSGMVATGPGGAAATAPRGTAAPADDGFELVDDDRLLWVPPWGADTPAPPLELVTPGVQVIVSLRPAQMLRADSAADWQTWFGPELGPTLETLQQRSGVAAQQIDRLVIGLLAGRDGEPVESLAVWLAEPIELETLRKRWDATASRTPEGHTIFAGDAPDADAYFVAGQSITDTSPVSAFAIGTVDHMRLVAEGDGGPVPLPRAMEMAWSQSNDQADVVVVASPNFLFADGRKLLERYAPRAIEPLQRLLIPNVTAAVVTLDTTSAWYGEVRLVPGGNTTAAGLMNVMQERIAELPALGEAFVVQTDVPATWRALAIRLPQYLRAISEQTRYGISQSLPTANFYLPAEAAPQVTLAALLALSSTAPPGTAMANTASPQPQTLSIDDMLDTNLSISFDQESLEFAVSMIGEEFAGSLPEGSVRPKITIIGGDLELSGITQNQQVRDFHMRDAPLRDVLTRLVLGANPDKTATGPADEKQSLIWVVDPTSSPDAPSLLITTRPQAEAKGYAMPREFTTQ